METKRDYYEVIGVARAASTDEIKRAFRRLAREYHPDVSKETDAEAKFKEINEAYAVLSDPQKRQMYDQFGHAGARGPFGAGVEGFPFGGISDIFETFFGGAQARRNVPQRGADLRVEVHLAFEEAVFGCEKEIEIPRLETCPSCNGTGAERGTAPSGCPTCGGTGRVRRIQQSIFGQFINVTTCDQCRGEGVIVSSPCRQCNRTGRVQGIVRHAVPIPAGIDDGSQIRISGEGEAGPRGGPPGNLYVEIAVEEHPLFLRQGNDIIYDLKLDVGQAALGAVIQVPTVDGAEDLRVPPGTQSGEQFRLKRRGVPYLRREGRGDQIVVARVETPTRLTPQQRDLFQQLAATFAQTDGHVDKEKDRGLLDKVKDAFSA